MSDEDRTRWDERYRAGAYEQRTHPSAIVQKWLPPSPGKSGKSVGRALDVAAGAGRNCVFMAQAGYSVVAVDVSEVGLSRAVTASPELEVILHDLDAGLPEGLGQFDVVVMVRYLNLPLYSGLIEHLRPGGMLITEVLLEGGSHGGVGPKPGRFRAQPGALRGACDGLRELWSYEGEVIDPDGRSATVAQFVGVL